MASSDSRLGHDRDEPARLALHTETRICRADRRGKARRADEAGPPPFGVEMKITDDNGNELPWDGKTFGRLKVSGPSVARAYYKDDSDILDDDGFFDTATSPPWTRTATCRSPTAPRT